MKVKKRDREKERKKIKLSSEQELRKGPKSGQRVDDMNNNVESCFSSGFLITCRPQPARCDRLAFVAALSRLYSCKAELG